MLFESNAAALARFYELEYRDYTEDSDFYVQYAHALDQERKLPILELGCGTGRLLRALSEAGFSVTGVDTSQEMLELARQRLEEAGTDRQVDLVCADMRHLEGLEGMSGGPFNMAFCALNTFAYLTSSEEQLAMLRGLIPLLVTHGILILDLTPPFPHLLSPDDGDLILQGTFHDEQEGLTLHKLVSGQVDYSTQTHDVSIFYDLVEATGGMCRFTDELTLRWTGRHEMELLLQAAGYKVEKLYGGYELEEFGAGSERMIFVART